MDRRNLADWISEHALTANTLDPRAPLDDLEPLRDMVGGVSVVAIGESAHLVHEFYLLRQRLLRFLSERCGFDVYAFEGPHVEAESVDAWVQGEGTEPARDIATAGIAMGLGHCREMHAHLEWMREHNRAASRKLRYAGTNPSGEVALRLVGDYLSHADPDALPLLNGALELCQDFRGANIAAGFENYAALDPAVRDELTATVSRLVLRMEMMADWQRSQGRERPHATAVGRLRGFWHQDHLHRDFAGTGIPAGTAPIDAFMAGSVLRRLQDDPQSRIVLALHNTHLRRTPIPHEGAFGLFPAGYHLAQALGEDYLAIAVTCHSGRAPTGALDSSRPLGFRFDDRTLPPVANGAIEAAFGADAPLTIADLRAARLEVNDGDSFQRMRMEDYFMDVPVLRAFDAVAHVPHTTSTDFVTSQSS